MVFKKGIIILSLAWVLSIGSCFITDKAVRDKKIAEEKTAKLQLLLHIEESSKKDTVGKMDLAEVELQQKDKEIQSLKEKVNTLQDQLREVQEG